MTEQASATASVLAETKAIAGAARAGRRMQIPSPLQATPAFKRLASLEPPRRIAGYGLAVLIGVLGAAEFARSRQPARPTGARGLPQPISARTRSLRLPSSYLLNAAQLVSTGEVTSGSGLWSLTTSKGLLRASQWHVSSRRILTDPTVPAGPRPKTTSARFDIVSLGPAHYEVLGVITSLNSRIHVELRDLAHAGLTVLSGDTPELPLASGSQRDVGLATWTGTTPDLIVVDRSSTTPVIHVQVFSATSDFHQELLDVVVPRGPFPAHDYSVLIGAVNSPTADLMLVTRGSTSSSHTEVHVLLGPQAFQIYGEQSPVNLPAALPSNTTLLLGREAGLAVLYSVDRASGVLTVVPLA
jgi:hypothetical protein